ncbi:MAG: hypothetical protein A2X52_05155 [Candidatus Rokubacteria bacterium GWC2_70_16]|nr:MAG: hypothetical protein A2X52_05155 [Candidatus Rokubacteria bacterium GWC2_70_16]OGL21204.1 MAG: hypothetical protein A3K12_15420 [Candidatus Rokubacteria bacterium RIFCSPLOWO2_12_FULL_71_19]
MSGRFAVDLLHPGRVAVTWQEWFVGSQGRRRLGFFVLGAAGVLLLVLVGGILPTYWRLSADLSAIPRLQRDLAAAESDLGLLRTNLQALAAEARRQVRWADLMTAFSQQTPPAIKIQSIESTRSTPPAPPGQAPQEVRPESVLRIEALTALRPGSPPLLEIAQFMAGLMRDPTVSRRFQLRSWEIKPPAGGATEGVQFLGITIVLSERPS